MSLKRLNSSEIAPLPREAYKLNEADRRRSIIFILLLMLVIRPYTDKDKAEVQQLLRAHCFTPLGARELCETLLRVHGKKKLVLVVLQVTIVLKFCLNIGNLLAVAACAAIAAVYVCLLVPGYTNLVYKRAFQRNALSRKRNGDRETSWVCVDAREERIVGYVEAEELE